MDVEGVHTPPYATMHAVENAWDDDDQALMELLLFTTPEVAETSPGTTTERRLARAAQTIDAATKSNPKPKIKLSATEKKARHREVVRRSYHRNKVRVFLYFENGEEKKRGTR